LERECRRKGRFYMMPDPIEELIHRWKQNPSPGSTIALCDALRASPRGPLVQQVGEFATQRHARDVSVLVSVARMYMEARRFADAQAVLVAAGKQAPRDGAIYRWLGEVLLRRGDADRAEKVLERAVQLGERGSDADLWLERARTFRPMQARAGARVVAAEVAHIVDRAASDSGEDTTASFRIAQGAHARADHAEHNGLFPPPLPAFPSPNFADELDVKVLEPVPTGPAVPRRLENPFAALPVERVAVAGRPPLPPAPVLPEPTRDARPLVPHPRDVLDALALAGVYEPPARGAPGIVGWARPAKGPKRKGAATLVAGMVLFVAASVGIYLFYRDKRAQEHVQAETLLASVEADLHASKPDALPETEKKLAQAFQLESRSPRAALDWVRERAMVGVVKGGADVAFEDAMGRAKEVGLPEEKYAFARVASFLFQGDTAGAAAVLPRWDGPAAGDAWYQLVAGATLERAGDARSRDRYAAAAKLEPDLVVAKVAQARATAIDGDAQEAMRLAKALRAAMPDRAEPVALVALAWGRDPLREDSAAPPELDELPRREAELPSTLKFVPHAVAALRAFDKHNLLEARAEVQKGLALAESPGAAVWLGTIALPMGNEALARKGALAAVQLSAVYEPARALAARVALLGGRLDEALKATEDLEATSPQVAVVRAASAYERVDGDGIARALETLPSDARKLPFLGALNLSAAALSGRLQLDAAKLSALAANEAPWSDLVAMDMALDAGDLASADKIATSWGKEAESQALRALRLARLARYEGRLDAADSLSQAALDHGTVTPRVLWERAYLLVARGRAGEVAALLGRYPLVLGPLATWLSAYATASGGSVEAAKGKTASLDPPPSSSPFEARIVAAAAFGAAKDKRRGSDFVRELLATGNNHPDLVAAALSLGFRKVDRGRRRPTYE
jgi:predicted Zn-dependent protease